jgi:hypothetical protein
VEIFNKLLLAFSLSIIFYQDLKNREVWLLLFPLFTITGGYLFFQKTIWQIYLYNILINLGIVLSILLINFSVARLILKKKFLSQVFGLGDVLFFLGFPLLFPTISFINFFVFSLLFTYVVHLIFNRRIKKSKITVPLAGYMALYLLCIYIVYWLGFYPHIYDL